jgi:uncharacterized pyridoxal phosphate-containing UPF0001 family protein
MTALATTRDVELANALTLVRERLERAAEAAGRKSDEIELLPITKFFPASDVLILSRLGCPAFGESREQEAVAKSANAIPSIPLRDSLAHGRPDSAEQGALDRELGVRRTLRRQRQTGQPRSTGRLPRALAEGGRAQPLRIYIQISLDGDVERGGVDIAQTDLVDELCAQAQSAQALEFVGLMGIPPLGSDPRKPFARLQAEHQRVQQAYQQRLELSAGMSSDLEAAVEHGSTCVRVGTALLGQRPLTSP